MKIELKNQNGKAQLMWLPGFFRYDLLTYGVNYLGEAPKYFI